METSSAYHDSLDPTNLANFKNKLNLPGRDGLLGLLDASAGPAELVARRERVQLAPGKETESWSTAPSVHLTLAPIWTSENSYSTSFGE